MLPWRPCSKSDSTCCTSCSVSLSLLRDDRKELVAAISLRSKVASFPNGLKFAHAQIQRYRCACVNPRGVNSASSLQSMEFPRPKLKRKKGAGGLRGLLGEEGKEADEQKCRGVLVGCSVVVHRESDISALLRLGFYGKGAFSRSFPTHAPAARAPSTTVGASSEARSRVGGCGGDQAMRKRRRLARELSEASGEGEEQRKRRRLLLHVEWSRERLLLAPPPETESESCEGPSSAGLETEDPAVGEEGGGAVPAAQTPGIVSADDPYPVTEPLCLTAEEAFYLMAELSILQVSLPPPNSATQSLPPHQLWARLCRELSRFPFTYSVYRHYRRKRWVPKPGLKFGVDFILYKDGPDSFHSSYAVLVCENFEEEEEEEGVAGCEVRARRLRWMEVVAHCRVSESTAKEMVVVRVTVPRGCALAHLQSSPETVEQLSLSETLVTRWVPDRDR